MSSASSTKVSGMKLGAEPKKIVILAILLVVAVGMFIYNSQTNSQSGGGETNTALQTHAPAAVTPSAPAISRGRNRTMRRTSAARDRGVLRIQHIDPRNGDVDPTLRLDLLARLQSVQPITGGRSLFELGPAPSLVAAKPIPAVTIVPKPLMGMNGLHPGGSMQPAFTIPLKFYGFEKPTKNAASSRGFFLDGDKILVASEGDLLKQRYLVVELTPNSAKLEDTQLKKGQTLPLVPEARSGF